MKTNQYIEVNQSNWNERVGIHADAASEYYDIDGFLAGNCSLKEIEVEAVGDVTGKKLLHAMCHFGLDSLSWARRKAIVTGVDFSQEAISLARELSDRSGLSANFLCANIMDLPPSLTGQFDVVYASYGVLCWLPDISQFISSLAACLIPGGIFYLIDGHPFQDMIDYNEKTRKLELCYSYFHRDEPDRIDCTHSYTNKTRILKSNYTYQWNHDIQSILDGLSASSLELLSLREYPYGFYQRYPNMVQNNKGQWVFPEGSIDLPLLMSVKARKPM